MYHHIDKLREKPLHVRKQIAGVAAMVITFFIFMFWLSGTGFSQKGNVAAATPEKNTAKTSQVATKTGPLTASIANAFSGFSVFKTSLSNVFGSHKSYTAPNVEVIEIVPDAQ